MPEELRSPLLTAEWENALMRIERGELTDQSFLSGITDIVTSLVRDNTSLAPEDRQRFASASGKQSIGACPWCGAPVYEGKANWYCSDPACKFRLWKNSRFLDALKKPMTKAMAAEFLKSGRVHAKGLYSSRTGKTFDADIVRDNKTDPDRGQMISFRLEFPETGRKKKARSRKKAD